MTTSKRFLAVILVVFLLCLVGCGKGPEKGKTSAKRTLVIAVVPKGTTQSFWLAVKAGAEDAAKETGARIIWKGPAKETDVAGQKRIIENFINQRVDAIVMAACNEKALVPTVEQADKAGIPVITIDSGVKSNVPKSFIATDNIEGARQAARTLAKLIGEKGEVGLIPFVKGAATSNMREQGFKEEIAKYKNIKLVSVLYSNSDIMQGIRATEDMLTAHPKLAGIFAANEGGAVGAARALDMRGLSGKVKLVAFDAAQAEIDALKKGTIQALIVQNPYKMGYEGVKAAVAVISGEKVPARIDTGVSVVTLKNFNDPKIQQLLYPTKLSKG
ncbi:MAG: ABC transporter substrate-binding protein [Armatimonadota bacterium]|nr:ABC transporter substrate-binding protein [Armatimonadota bacterium]